MILAWLRSLSVQWSLIWKMKDLGKMRWEKMRYFLGIEVQQNSKGIHMFQEKYAKDVLVWESAIQ